MNNMNNCSDQTREKLKAAYMSRDLGVDFTREKFDRIIAAAEQERIRTLCRRKMIKVALVSLILCAACSGLLMGLITWEDASADNDDETKIIKQGDNLVIGNGVVDGDDMVGVTVEEYETIEDLPEEIREKAHFITVEGFEVQKIDVKNFEQSYILDTAYINDGGDRVLTNEVINADETKKNIANQFNKTIRYKGQTIYKQVLKTGVSYIMVLENNYFRILIDDKIKLETIVDGLLVS